jgi:Cof subfamily protein (haloacid dehalogenase superfamily)
MRVNNYLSTLYVSDLDGTLLHIDNRMSQFSIGTINSLVQSGILFSYATARSLISSSIVTNGINLNIPVVIYNGVFIIDMRTKEKLMKKHFKNSDLQNVISLLYKNKIYPFVYSYINHEEKISWLYNKETDGMKRYICNHIGDKRLNVIFEMDKLFDGEVFYITCITEKDKLEPIYHYLKNESLSSVFMQNEVGCNDYWLEIMPNNASKASAVLYLKEILRCDKLITFGDSFNDIDLFNISNECYAVSNAIPELKKVATGIIGSNDEDGVAIWLCKNVL